LDLAPTSGAIARSGASRSDATAPVGVPPTGEVRGIAPKYHPAPLSGGDRKALAKELSKSRAMTRIFAERSVEKRREGEALIREADTLAVAIFPAETRAGFDRLGFRFLCYSRMLLLTRVIGWINVSYLEWPLTVNLNDGRTACPTVVVHFGRCFGVSARR
jgi:hypothetical protein